MKIVNNFNENGKKLQEIIEKFLIKYCLEMENFSNENI